MWSASYEKTFTQVSKESIWSAWADVGHWPQWDKDLEDVKISGEFIAGTRFSLKPKGGPTVSIHLVDVKPGLSFTDVTLFPLARMFDHHELEETPEGLKIKSRIWMEGVLSWLWRKIVAQNVAAGVPAQTEALVKYAQQNRQKI